MKPEDYVVQLAVKASQGIGVEPIQQGTGGGSDANIINSRVSLGSIGAGLRKHPQHRGINPRCAVSEGCGARGIYHPSKWKVKGRAFLLSNKLWR